MKASTREWILKAEEDYLAATALSRRRKKPLWSIVCFQVQQAVEKYFKTWLEEAGLNVPKTHDLLHLLNLATPTEPLWSSYHAAFSLLVSYAVQTRYPGNSVTKSDAHHALKLCREFRREAGRALGLRWNRQRPNFPIDRITIGGPAVVEMRTESVANDGTNIELARQIHCDSVFLCHMTSASFPKDTRLMFGLTTKS
jgi:HEPN domain-containing protein